MADKIQVWTETGVLIRQWDDNTSTYTEYDPTTGALTITRAYTAQETSDAQARASTATSTANLANLRAKAQNALNNNATYLAIASPTNAQAVAQIGALTRQMDAVIRILMNLLSDTTNT